MLVFFLYALLEFVLKFQLLNLHDQVCYYNTLWLISIL